MKAKERKQRRSANRGTSDATATRMPKSLSRLPAFDDDTDCLNAVVEAVRGSRNKFKYDEKLALFIHDATLPAGQSWPFDFGFVPSTKGEDGDPIDVLI